LSNQSRLNLYLSRKTFDTSRNAEEHQKAMKKLSENQIQSLLETKRAAPPIPDTNSVKITYRDNPLFQSPQMFIKGDPEGVLDFINELDNSSKTEFIKKHPNISKQYPNIFIGETHH
jgi:glutaredoxin